MNTPISPSLLSQFCAATTPYSSALAKYGMEYRINTNARIAAFVAQLAVESAAFKKTHEIFDYTVDALLEEFAAHLTVDQAKTLGRQPGEAFVPADRQADIANLVYANRMGNGDAASGDGSRYRGRGLIEITGKNEYAECGAKIGEDLVTNPELLEQPAYAVISACWYFSAKGCNELADAGDFLGITRAINGGLNGEELREEWWARAKTIWPVAVEGT